MRWQHLVRHNGQSELAALRKSTAKDEDWILPQNNPTFRDSALLTIAKAKHWYYWDQGMVEAVQDAWVKVGVLP